jgi:Flp pilus assembly protein TadD
VSTLDGEAIGLASALGREFHIDPPDLPSLATPDTLFAGENQEIRLLLGVRPTAAHQDPDAPARVALLAVQYPRNIAILADLTLRGIYGRRETASAEALEPILVRQPDLVELEALYAELLLFFGRDDVLVGRLEKASVYPMFEADRIWRLGAAHLAAGQAMEADSAFALAAKVGAPPGRRWRRFQENAAPFAALRFEIKNHPDRPEPYVRLGVGLWNLGLFDQGYTQIQQGRVRAPKDSEPDYQLGHYLALEGRAKHAAAAFQRGLDKDPTHVLSRVELAYAQLQMGENDNALRNLQEAVSTGRADAQAHYNLACLLARKGDKESALRELETAIRKGYANRTLLESDPDLDAIRNDPRFRKILADLP